MLSGQTDTRLNSSQPLRHSRAGSSSGTGHMVPSLEPAFRKYLLSDGCLGVSVPLYLYATMPTAVATDWGQELR